VSAAAEELRRIADEIRSHRLCGFEPCMTCSRFVPGEGPADARVVLVSEAPGRHEDEAGRPFAGASGRVLDRLLDLAGLRRDEVYITNVVKARPPGNRDPRAAEIAHMAPWLDRELEALEPALVVAMGRIALHALAPGNRIGDVHGGMVEGRGGRSVFATYHPAASLHAQRLRGMLEEDFRTLGAVLCPQRARQGRQPGSCPGRMGPGVGAS
jgi:DNA polymerase